MRSQDSKSSYQNNIIELDYFDRSNPTEYIERIMYDVNKSLSSPESALLLSDLYDEEFGLYTNTTVDNQMGPVLYRPEEDVSDYSTLGDLSTIYLKFDINKFYGLNINQFLDLTRSARSTLINKVKIHMENISNELSAIQNSDTDNTNLDVNDFDL